MSTRIQVRRGTAAQWVTANPVLAVGEPGMETNTGKSKLGDGVTAWISLPYDASNQTVLNATFGTLVGNAALYAPAADSLQLARLSNVTALAEDATSHRLAQQYDDDLGKTHERWADLSAWNPTNKVTVSGGFIYGLASNSSPYGAAKAFVVPTATAFHVAASIYFPSAIPGGGTVAVGISPAAPPFLGFADTGHLWGIAGSAAKRLSSGAATNLTLTGGGGAGTALAAGIYAVHIWADTVRINVTITNADHSIEYVDSFPWTDFPTGINSVTLINLDERVAAGAGIRPLGATKSSNTINPRTPLALGGNTVEGVGDSQITHAQPDGSIARVVIPKSYDSRVPAPLCMFYHGSQAGGGNATWTDIGIRSVVQALLNAGYIVASTDGAGSDTWGNQASIDDNLLLYQYVLARFNIGPVVHLSQSMGGLTGLLSIAQRRVPAVGWAGIYPVCNLAALYADPGRTADINTAFGITGVNPHTYAEKTADHDPMLLDPIRFRGLPMRFYASAADTAVTKALNSDPFSARIAPYSPEETVVVHTGGHGDATAFQPSDVLAFFERCTRP